MTGITIIETEKLEEMIGKLDIMLAYVKATSQPLMSISQVAERTGLSKSTIERIKSDIGYTTIGGCYRFKRKDVELYIEENYLSRKAS